MKKFLFASLLMLVSIATFGQREIILKSDVTGKTSAQALGDTVVNATAKTQSSVSMPAAWNTVGVTVAITKISGTVAGVVRLFGSIDGVTYARIAATDSLNATNVASQGKLFNVLPSGGKWPYKYVRVSYTGTGTMSASFTSRALFK